jgi:hypothetical protein
VARIGTASSYCLGAPGVELQLRVPNPTLWSPDIRFSTIWTSPDSGTTTVDAVVSYFASQDQLGAVGGL